MRSAVVGREQPHPGTALLGGNGEDQGGLLARGKLEEQVLRHMARQQVQCLDAIGDREQRPGLADVLRRERLGVLAHRRA